MQGIPIHWPIEDGPGPGAGVSAAPTSRAVSMFAGAGAMAALAAILLVQWRRVAAPPSALPLAPPLALPFTPVTDVLLMLLCGVVLLQSQRRWNGAWAKVAGGGIIATGAATALVAGFEPLGLASMLQRWSSAPQLAAVLAAAFQMPSLVAGALFATAAVLLLGVPRAANGRDWRQARALLALVPLSISVSLLVEYSARAGIIDDYTHASVALLQAASLFALCLAMLHAAGADRWPLSLFRVRRAEPGSSANPWFERLGLWLFAIVMVAFLGIQSHELRHELGQARREAERNLAAVAAVKAREAEHWVGDREADAEMIRSSGPVRAALLRYLAGSRDSSLVRGLRAWMAEFSAHGGERRDLTLLDARGTPLLSASPHQFPAATSNVRQALDATDAATVRFWTTTSSSAASQLGSNAVAYNLLVPLSGRELATAPAGAVRIQADLVSALFAQAPASVPETFLVACRGDDVEVLNKSLDGPDSARSLFLSGGTRPAGAPVAGANDVGFQRFESAVDYRGVPVLVALSPIAGTPWSVAVKEDQSGVLLPVVRENLGNEAILGVMLMLAGLLAVQAAQSGEERAMRRQLRLSARFEQLMRQAGDIIMLVGPDGRIVEANDRAAESYGYPLPELVGMHVRDLQPPEVAPAVLVFLAEHLRTVGSVNADVLSRRKDGSVFPGEVNARQVEIDGETVVCCFIRDVTERVRDTGALRASEERWKFALEGAGHGVWDLDVPSERVQLSQLANELLDLEHDDATSGSDSIPANIHSEDESRVRSAWKAFFSGEVRTYASEYRIVGRDGRVKWVHTRGLTVSRDAEGRPLRVIGTHADITEAKSLVTDLQESHDLLAALASQVPGALFQCELSPDGRTRIPFSSGAIRDLFGVTPDEVRDDASVLFSKVHPDDIAALVATIGASASSLQSSNLEFRVVLPGQGVRWLQAISHPQHLEDGSTLWHGFITDITDRRRLEAGVNEVRKMEAIGQLAGGIAHDFNNLLTAITGYTYLADDSLPADALARGDIRQIRLAAERAGMMTKKLLSFAYQEEIEVGPLRLDRLLFDLEGLLRRLLGEQIEIVISAAGGLWPIRADQGELEQVFINLGVNARDAMAEGGLLTFSAANLTLDVEAGARLDIPPGEYVELAVSDTGCGMSEEVRRRVFEPFYTTKEKGRGTGLGLAIVWGAVQRLGAHVRLSSTLGVGTTFRFFFSRTTEEVPSDADDLLDSLPRGTESVLLVEDDALVRGVVCKILQKSGYAVLVATGPHAALDIVSDLTQSIDLLLTDIVMPLMSGAELAERVRGMRPDIPVVLMSGYSRERVSDVLRANSGYLFLAKPFTEKRLLDRISEALASRSTADWPELPFA